MTFAAHLLVSTNPSDDYAVLGEVPCSTPDEVQAAVDAARAAQPGWAGLSLQQRSAAVESFTAVCEQHAEQINQLIAAETGRPIRNTRGGTTAGLDYLRRYSDLAARYLEPHISAQDEHLVQRIHREPWGVIAVICPWNFPFLNVAWSCGPALLAGNTVVYKNSEENPLFTQLLARLVAQSDLPAGVLTTVIGGAQVGHLLVTSGVDKITFTGSVETGRALTALAAQQFIPITTELGGSSPGLVFQDVEVSEELAHDIFWKRFLHSGQICDAIKRLIVHESLAQPLTHALVEVAARQRLGDAREESTDLGPLVAHRQVQRIEEQVADALERGATVHCGGRRPEGLRGAYYEPTILTGITPDMRVWREETFGPVLPIVTFTTEQEALQLANDTTYGLSAYVFTNDADRFARCAQALRVGGVGQGTTSIFDPNSPFGGWKASGLGRTNGEEGFHAITQTKLIATQR